MKKQLKNKTILQMNSSEAKKFFMKPHSYLSTPLPTYFDFNSVLQEADDLLNSVNFELKSLCKENTSLSESYNVNYKLLLNKDGLYDWRPINIVHPLCYVNLVNIITKNKNWNKLLKRFKQFQFKNIKCISMPLESNKDSNDDKETILNWWMNLEQASIRYALDYKYCLKTDIINCYGSIYTHTIAWAIEGKNNAKKYRNDKNLLGNKIDKNIEWMQNGQTNGIPQCGELFNFVAEMVLGYSDKCLNEAIENRSSLKDYKIIRYRDDYRIFTNSKEDAEKLVRILADVLSDLNMHFNSKKTSITTNIIEEAVKKDKRYWSLKEDNLKNTHLSLQKQLLQILELSNKFPNSGSVIKALSTFLKKISKMDYNQINQSNDIEQIISIVVNIMIISPKAIPQEAGILSNIFEKMIKSGKNKDEVDMVVEKIMDKLSSIPNTEYINIWLQRLSIMGDKYKNYNDVICNLVDDYIFQPSNVTKLWNSKWIQDDYFHEIDLIDRKELNKAQVNSINIEDIDPFFDEFYGFVN